MLIATKMNDTMVQSGAIAIDKVFSFVVAENCMSRSLNVTDRMLIAFQHGSTVTVVAFVAICIGIVASILLAAWMTTIPRRNALRVVVILATGIALYLFATTGIVTSGILFRAFIPFGPLYFAVSIAVAISIGFTRLGIRFSEGMPLAWLVGFQSFRLPLEVVLHEWYVSGTIPESMTWSGSNWDILSGIVALAFCPFVSRWRTLAWIPNVVGIVLLVNVGRVAVLSSPVPFGWDVNPKLELIAYLPYAFIVPICVGGAALGHVVLTRKLLSS